MLKKKEKSTAVKLKAVPTESGCLKRAAVKLRAVSTDVGLPKKYSSKA